MSAASSSRSQAAAIAGRDVFFFATVPFDFALLGRTRYLALGLSALGARVTFVEPPSIKKSLRRLRLPVDAPPEIDVLGMPPSVPKISDRLPIVPRVHDRAQRLWLGLNLKGRAPIAVVSTPRWVPVLRGLPFDGIFYDCLDDLAVHAEPARMAMFEAWESELIRQARGCFAVSPALAEVLASRGAREVVVHGNGVCVDELLRGAFPPDEKGSRRRIGYLGAIYEWVDVALLLATARAFPEHELYLVGPVRRGVDVSALRRAPNVRLLGYRPYPDVPKAMASFDVGLIPFKEGAVARGADPIKIYEYFCFGMPVVTTPVSDVERIGDLLYVASGPAAFEQAVAAALDERDEGLRARRVAYAREHDWAERARTLASALCAAR